MLKKKLYSAILGGIISLLIVSPIFAAPSINDLTSDIASRSGYDAAGTTELTLSETVGKIIRVVLSLVGTVFLALIIYAGFLWMTAGGDEGKVESAMNIIKMCTIGLIIVLAGYGITTFVVGVITTTAGTPGGRIGPGAGNAGFWSSFGKNFKDNWWNYVF